MRTFIADIIPKIQRYSKQLDELTKLTNQHWVSLNDITKSKRVFIFRPNNQLIISENGIVERGSWEYLGNQSLLLETKAESYLLKHGFFDENVIALKLDSTNNYAFFINETKYNNELNNIYDILKFLEEKYLTNNSTSTNTFNGSNYLNENGYKEWVIYDANNNKLVIITKQKAGFASGDTVYINGDLAKDGEYKLGFMQYLKIKNGKIVD
jgi:hypothetical protein